MQAIILAGGFGTRLQSVVKDVPKPMADINGKPFLHYLITSLKKNDVDKIVISVGYLQEKIIEYFGDNYLDIDISYAKEDTPLGTGGAIKNSLQPIDLEKPVLVLNGDSFLEFDLKKFTDNHLKNNRNLSIILRKMDDCSRYGRVICDENSIITGFEEKSSIKKSGFINGGIYLINPKIFSQFSLPQSFSFEVDFLMKSLDQIKPEGLASDGYFIDIGIPDDYKKAQNELKNIIEK